MHKSFLLLLLLWHHRSMAAWSNLMFLGNKDRVSEQNVSERRLTFHFILCRFYLFQTIWLARILSIRFTKDTKSCFTSLPCCLSLQTIHNRWRTCVQLSLAVNVKSRADFLLILWWWSPSSSPGYGHCVMFLDKTLCCHSTSLHPGVWMGSGEMLGATKRNAEG